MPQAYLIAIHGVSRGQQLEVAEVGGQDQDAAPGSAAHALLPLLEAFVAHLAHQAAVKKTTQADVFGAAASEVHIRAAQDAQACLRGEVGKGYFEVAQPDLDVALVQMKTEQ